MSTEIKSNVTSNVTNSKNSDKALKVAIVYKSKTGNTKVIAEAISKAIPEENLIFIGSPNEINKSNINADLYIIGSWTNKGSCVEDISKFLTSLKNKKIAYFGTAGFGGSEDYFEKVYSRMSAFIDDSNEIVGHFFCQGKMPMIVRDRYVQMLTENPDDANLQVSVKNFDEALNHPDETDKENAMKWIKEVLGTM